MYNTIMGLVLAGALTASGAQHLLRLENKSQQVSSQYAHQANLRFEEYEQMLPGSVEWPGANLAKKAYLAPHEKPIDWQ